ncbi:MAG: Glycosyl transferase group 1 [Thermotoga sp. 50_1627]|uniref:glycosyltransferase n=1 Tax=Pseudothermotoga sp. TaxID=2033661 RepID=UPI00076D01FB|nr:MAG: Glycosyl transferase group 1 [Thermotoga sp. 50_64]KUK25516.1 MAG: Glycosyl transferase group 1 [Thermotoga sp. 50_1627]MBC7115790.1 glycosyltransferase [Pseudothermotoga sp.]MDK2923757.1 trehalose synthase [Pseudothermotoga sp.]HBT38945.1 glycosyl transferase family 1 [Pseudothermotoga sp.]
MRVKVTERSIEEYRGLVEQQVEEIKQLARSLKGLKVVHINATAYGGGVAEILQSLVPLMNSIGLKTEWRVIEAPGEFFNVTKKFHNTLQGASLQITEEEWKLYEDVCRANAELIDGDEDIVVIHDPQPAAIRSFVKTKTSTKWIWRCHIDLSTPNQTVWNRFSSYVRDYNRMIFHLEEYFPKNVKERCRAFPPSIDPLSEKNIELNENFVREVLKKLEIDPERPLITVVARFDPWKDLFSAVDVYRLVKREVPSVQLAIVSAMASDDPEGWLFFEKVLRYAGTDEDIKFCTNLKGVGSKEVNAIQRNSTVALHTATREGFGLVISEALYKRVPVVARPVGGVKIQIKHGENGYLAWEKDELAGYILELMRNENLRRRMGEQGRRIVLEKFITTANLVNYLKTFLEVLG